MTDDTKDAPHEQGSQWYDGEAGPWSARTR